MKILNWFKNLLSITKKDYMLNESNNRTTDITQEKKEFIPKFNDSIIEHKKTREDILRSLKDDIIVENFSEEYNYNKFSPKYINEKYDADSILSNEDVTALSCLYGAIKYGNMWYSKPEIINGELKITNNKINDFLRKSPNNIVVLINLMEKYAKDFYDSLGDQKLDSTTVQGLIPGSYDDIYKLIKEYEKENGLKER